MNTFSLPTSLYNRLLESNLSLSQVSDLHYVFTSVTAMNSIKNLITEEEYAAFLEAWKETKLLSDEFQISRHALQNAILFGDIDTVVQKMNEDYLLIYFTSSTVLRMCRDPAITQLYLQSPYRKKVTYSHSSILFC